MTSLLLNPQWLTFHHFLPRMNDQQLEVVGLYSAFHVGKIQVNLAEPLRLGQASEIKVIISPAALIWSHSQSTRTCPVLFPGYVTLYGMLKMLHTHTTYTHTYTHHVHTLTRTTYAHIHTPRTHIHIHTPRTHTHTHTPRSHTYTHRLFSVRVSRCI